MHRVCKNDSQRVLLKNLFLACRPQTLVATIVPVCLAAALAIDQGVFVIHILLKCLLMILGLQIGTNLVNDYYDYQRGADTDDRIGPSRVTQNKLIPPSLLFVMIFCFFGLSLFVASLFGRNLFFLTCFFVWVGYSYTGGSYPLAYHGLGDLFAFIFFGPVAVLGQFYLYSASYSLDAFFLGVGVGFFSMALITVNNLRDRTTDAKAGKKTTSVCYGSQFSKWQYTLSLFFADSVFFFFFLRRGNLFFLVGFFIFVLCSISVMTKIWKASLSGSMFKTLLSQTSQLFFLYGLYFSCILWML